MSLGTPTPIEVAVSGPNLAAHREFSQKVKDKLQNIPTLRDVQFGQALDYPTVDVAINRERAGIMGVKMAEVSRSLVAATSSSRFVVPNFWADPNSGVAYQIQVQIPQNYMDSVEAAENIPVTYRNGQAILLRNIANVTQGATVGQYERYNMQRMITVTANLGGADLGSVSQQVMKAIKELGNPPPRVSVAVRGQVVPMQQMLDSLRTGLLLAVVVIFLLLAANFQSVKLSIIVVSTVPAVMAGVVLLGLPSGCDRGGVASSPAKTELPIDVKTVRPFKGAITRNVTLPGEVKAYHQATLYAKVAGYLKTITVDKGDRVRESDLIADIEVPEMLADLAKYKAEVEVAQLDYQRLSESQKKAPDLVVPQTVDHAKGTLDVAKANLERTRTLLSFAKITAPFSGIVTKRMVDPGAFIPSATSGSAAQNAAIVTLTDFNKVRVQVAVPELETSLIATDQPAMVTVEGLPGRNFDGKITRFSYTLDEATKTMLAEIELPNPKLELRPGMYAIVRIGLERKEDALLVPAEALVVERAGAFVFTINDHEAKKTRVQTGFNDGTNVEIVSGVKPDQPVILVGKRVLSDGHALKPSEDK